MNLQEFMKLSWGEISTKVEQAIVKEYENDAYCYIVDMFEDAAIVRFYYYMENGSKLMKIKYSCDENGNVSLGDIVEVRVVYEEVVNVSNTSTEVEEVGVENATETIEENAEEQESELAKKCDEEEKRRCVESDDDKDEKEDTEEDSTDDPEDKDDDDDDKVVCAACGDVEEQPTADAADVSNAEVTETERVVSDGNEQVAEETNTSSASFSDSERAEFETLKREKKINILNSYKEILSEEEFNNFLGSIDSFEESDLELELLKAYKASKDKEPKIQRAFAFAPILEKNNADKNSLDDFIRKNL